MQENNRQKGEQDGIRSGKVFAGVEGKSIYHIFVRLFVAFMGALASLASC